MDLTTIHQGVKKRKKRKRVGRGIGSGMGKTATRGHKGMYAATGAKKPKFTFEGGQMQLFRRMPKRGFSHATWDKDYHIVNLDQLEATFNDGDTVDPDALTRARLTRGPAAGVRILGRGELTKRLTVKAHHFTKSAAEKIASKGGSTEVLPGRNKPVRNKMKPKPAKS